MCSDASAALGVIQRQGLGRLRHVDGNFLFVQSLVARWVVQYTKVLGSDILADMCSRGLNVELMTRHVSAVDGRYSAGRPTLCPEVFGIQDSVRSSSGTRNSVEQCCVLKKQSSTGTMRVEPRNRSQGPRSGARILHRQVLDAALTCTLRVHTLTRHREDQCFVT